MTNSFFARLINRLLIETHPFQLSVTRVQSKPQITKLFPTQENRDVPQQQSANEAKPLDKLLGKLRATYNHVFRKPENTSSVETILAKDTPDPDVQALKLIRSNRMQQSSADKAHSKNSEPQRTYLESNDDLLNSIQPVDRLEPLEPLELDDEVENENDREIEIVTPRNTFEFPITLSRHLVDWLGSLLGITYGIYSKLTRAIYNNNTTIRVA